MLEQLRVNWIASPERQMLGSAIHSAVAAKIAASLPTGLPTSLVIELAQAALAEVDAWIAKPVQVQAGKNTIKDHRG